jgi:spermidine synthase
MTDASVSAVPEPRTGTGALVAVGGVFLVSGAVSLVYQVLWMKELGLLFGNTAQATATTLTAFFLGLATGGWTGGRLAPRLRRPLRAYGLLELGIAACALLYFLLFGAYEAVYPALYRTLGGGGTGLVLAKFLLGVVLLVPASFFMGATFPVLGQHVVRDSGMLGRRGSALYAVNTLGAALGAYAAGFHLPRLLGFNQSYLLAILVNVGLGLAVLGLGRGAPALAAGEPVPAAAVAPPVSWGRIRALAVLTGFVTLGLEVLWTHMFAQVLHNSVYTFAIILITFLTALALGSVLAHVLIRMGTPSVPTVMVLLLSGGGLVGLSPALFQAFTHGLSYIADKENWAGYQLRVFALAGGVMFVPTLLIGTLFPYLLKLSEGFPGGPGRTIGRLAAINTSAAILGSLAAGFLLLEWIGLWPSVRVLAVLAVLGAFIPSRRVVPPGREWTVVPMGVLFLVLSGVITAGQPPRVKVDPAEHGERLLQVWEGSMGVVAVVQDDHGLKIKVDNHYSLGGSASERAERRQGTIPLLLHPAPRDVFFLGMGTGITAGAAVTPAVKSITICELVPDAVTAAREYFGPYTGGLFEDPRTRILAEDGRNYLRATGASFDVIISDLFVPWKRGSGSLYTLEHYRTVLGRLNPGGLFAQWIPLYQVSRREFDIIARTMLEVFPSVTAWRGDFHPRDAILALIGHTDPEPLDPEALLARLGDTEDPDLLLDLDSGLQARENAFLLGYAGNLTEARALVDGAPVNTDDRPRIEYSAPITHRRVGARKDRWFNQDRLLGFLEALREAVPWDRDPYLERLTAKERAYCQAGFLLHKGKIERDEGREEDAARTAEELEAFLHSVSGM